MPPTSQKFKTYTTTVYNKALLIISSEKRECLNWSQIVSQIIQETFFLDALHDGGHS